MDHHPDYNDLSASTMMGITLAVALVTIFTFAFEPHDLLRMVQAIAGRWHILKLVNHKKKMIDGNRDATLSGIFIYPVKSLQAVALKNATLDHKGLVGDRRSMVVAPRPVPLNGQFAANDATHQFMTQRQIPILATIQSQMNDKYSQLTLTCGKDKVTLQLNQPNNNLKIFRARIWDDVTQVVDMGDEVATFLQTVAAKDKTATVPVNNLRLVKMAKDDRVTDDKYTPRSALSWTGAFPKVGLTDGFPILIANEASLDELNQRLTKKGKPPIKMNRFRPNLVVKGAKPFEEDNWRVIAIGDIIFHIVKGCPRCKQSCTDQTTGQVYEEPLATLREFRAVGPIADNVYFAQNALAHTAHGEVKVGDAIRVLERGDPIWDT